MIATIWLTGCATVGSETHSASVCPLVVDYSRKFQAGAAEELDQLPKGSAVAEMLVDYAVIREQAQAFGRIRRSLFAQDAQKILAKALLC